MPFELILFLIALLLIAFCVWRGWQLGATVELRQTLTCLFATLVALRYWYSLTLVLSNWITLDPHYLAIGSFLALFLISWLIAAFIVNLKGERYQSVFSNPLNQGLGALSGMLSGGLMAGAFLMLLALALPGSGGTFDPTLYPVRLDHFPKTAFQMIEQTLAQVPVESSARTPLPELTQGASGTDPSVTLVWK